VEHGAAAEVHELVFVDSDLARERERQVGHALRVAFRFTVTQVERA
jgi:hypothetical protein